DYDMYDAVRTLSILKEAADTKPEEIQIAENRITAIQNQQSEPEGTYLVTTLYGADVSELKVTMTFDNKNKTVSGYSGCNTYSCSYEQLEGGSVTFGIPNASKRMCLENTKVEKTFFKALSNSKKNSAKELGYIFKNSDDEAILDTKKVQ
ncbi:META domain-containing protein, partial [Aquimarina sp. RZ0]|uniref:META domain-containing protein n=1 Tax=Aquimarina sp. RZ0 TaxID=2607730 RepID=UPI0011F316A7